MGKAEDMNKMLSLNMNQITVERVLSRGKCSLSPFLLVKRCWDPPGAILHFMAVPDLILSKIDLFEAISNW
jgi:hypothetical protein